VRYCFFAATENIKNDIELMNKEPNQLSTLGCMKRGVKEEVGAASDVVYDDLLSWYHEYAVEAALFMVLRRKKDDGKGSKNDDGKANKKDDGKGPDSNSPKCAAGDLCQINGGIVQGPVKHRCPVCDLPMHAICGHEDPSAKDITYRTVCFKCHDKKKEPKTLKKATKKKPPPSAKKSKKKTTAHKKKSPKKSPPPKKSPKKSPPPKKPPDNKSPNKKTPSPPKSPTRKSLRRKPSLPTQKKTPSPKKAPPPTQAPPAKQQPPPTPTRKTSPVVPGSIWDRYGAPVDKNLPDQGLDELTESDMTRELKALRLDSSVRWNTFHTREHNVVDRSRDITAVLEESRERRKLRGEERARKKRQKVELKRALFDTGEATAAFPDEESEEEQPDDPEEAKPEKLVKFDANRDKLRSGIMSNLFPGGSTRLTREERHERDEAMKVLSAEEKANWVAMETESLQVCDIMFVPSSYDPEQPERPYFVSHYRVMGVRGRRKAASPDRIRSIWMKYNFDTKFLSCCQMRPRQWIPVPIGDSNDRRAPLELLTDVKLKYEQKDGRALCLYNSLASVLSYLGWQRAAKGVARLGNSSEHIPGKDQVKSLLQHLRLHVPQFGQPVKFNRGTSSRGTRNLDMEELIREKTARPIILIPLGEDGQVSHAVCVIHDLIFDSTQTCAMKLVMDSFHWTCGRCGCAGVWEAYLLQPYGCKEEKRRIINHF